MRFRARFGIFPRRLETGTPVALALGRVLLPEPQLLQRLLLPPLFGEVYASKIGWESSGHPYTTRLRGPLKRTDYSVSGISCQPRGARRYHTQIYTATKDGLLLTGRAFAKWFTHCNYSVVRELYPARIVTGPTSIFLSGA